MASKELLAAAAEEHDEHQLLGKAAEADPTVVGARGAEVATRPSTPPAPVPIAAYSDDTSRGAGPGDAVPDPYTSLTEGPLSETETTKLAACEQALDQLRVAFWLAGKALQTIRDARLYRNTHNTFEDYVEDMWQMSRAQAYRLIEAWPLAQRLSQIGDRLTESQVRVLRPLTVRFGEDAAVLVYQTIAQAEGLKVTADVLKGAVAVLPEDHFEPDEAAQVVRDFIGGR